MRRKIKCLSLILSAMIFLSSCGSVPFNWKIGEKISVYTEHDRLSSNEVRLIALQYKSLYESYYSELLGRDFWDEKTDGSDTFEEYVKEYCVWNECCALMYLMSVAEEKDYTLTAFEKEKAAEAAEQYFSALTADQLEFTGASKEDAEQLIGRYIIADKVVSELIQGKKLEVSDEESRVSDIQVIHVATEAEAQRISELIRSGENFATLARENTIDDEILYSVRKGMPEETLNNIIFSMHDNDVSDIVCYEDSYYIIRMVNSYNTLLSANYKANLMAERRFEGWKSVYERYAAETHISRDAEDWAELSLKTEGDFPPIDLFELFHNQ